jgi:Fe-S-cluster formation regulator IscX/YfhJ
MNNDNQKGWFVDHTDNKTIRFYDLKTKVVYMPWDIDPEDYSEHVKGLVKSGYVIQLEIV